MTLEADPNATNGSWAYLGMLGPDLFKLWDATGGLLVHAGLVSDLQNIRQGQKAGVMILTPEGVAGTTNHLQSIFMHHHLPQGRCIAETNNAMQNQHTFEVQRIRGCSHAF
jgi:hypothetical protein